MVLEGQSDLPALSSLIAKQVEAGDYMKEIWKDIPGFEGCYQASTLGRIRSLDRTITRGASKRRGPYEAKLKGRIIKPVLRKDGYVRVKIDGEVKDLSEEIVLEKNKKHNILVIIDRVIKKLSYD